ncbi:MAG: hypothetical protein H6739_02625 [Alphaproteobacteria bacterium]|nr:hypothetical protein [Alphaproteobacteria bacterium]
MSDRRPDPMLAGILSLIVPGVGQFYAGRVGWGILWLIITPGFWIGTGGFFGWVCHVIAAVQAHGQAKDY